jgi:hypothetical protein
MCLLARELKAGKSNRSATGISGHAVEISRANDPQGIREGHWRITFCSGEFGLGEIGWNETKGDEGVGGR